MILFPIGLYGSTSGGGGGGSLLLDSLSATSVAAYSTRKLRTAYAGNCIKVRRSSDNATQDIGFDGSGNLDTSALATFVGSNSAYVNTWYDQSGNGNNATQVTTALQPRIVNAGTNDTYNSHVAFRYDNSGTYLTFAITQAQPLSVAFSAKLNSVVNDHHFTDGVSSRVLMGVTSTDKLTLYAGGSVLTGTAIDTSSHCHVGVLDGASSIYYLDGASAATGNAGSAGMSTGGQYIGLGQSGGIDGWIGDYIVFSSSIGSTDRSTIRTSQQSYWATA